MFSDSLHFGQIKAFRLKSVHCTREELDNVGFVDSASPSTNKRDLTTLGFFEV
jgi:hypothetical protein